MLKKIASDSFVYFLGAFFNQVAGFVVVILLMRNLGVGLFGVYSYAAAVVMLFSVLADGGISQFIVKQVNAGIEPIPVLYRRFQSFQMGVSIAILGMLLIVAFGFHSAREAILICLIGAATVLSGYLTTAFSFFIAAGERWIIFGRDVVFGISRLILVMIGVYSDLSLEYFCAITVLAQLAILVFVLVIRQRRELSYLLSFRWNFDGIGKLALAALPYTMLALVNIVYNKIDVILLKGLSTPVEVGYYAGATQFVYPFMFVSSAIMAAIYPMLTRSLGNRSEFDKVHYISTVIMGAIGVIMSGFLYLCSTFFYPYFFSHQYDGSLPIYRILVWYLALVFFYGGYSNTIVANGGVRFLVKLNTLMILANLVANYVVIPQFGAYGAAIVTICCELLILVVLVVYYEGFMRKSDNRDVPLIQGG